MGSQQALVLLLSHSRLFWVAVINAMTKANLEEERFISPHPSMSQSVTEEVRAGTQAETLGKPTSLSSHVHAF